MKCRSCPGRALGGDDAIVIFNDLLADSQPDTGSAVFRSAMKALKYFEDLLAVLLLESYAIILEADMIILFCRWQITSVQLTAVDDVALNDDMGRHFRL